MDFYNIMLFFEFIHVFVNKTWINPKNIIENNFHNSLVNALFVLNRYKQIDSYGKYLKPYWLIDNEKKN